jgi:hypothetical protein
MIRQVGYGLTIILLAVLLWQLASPQPALPAVVCGVFLVFISLLAGVRLGTDSASSYIQDLQRVNKVLAEQNRDLEDLNRSFLAKAEADSPESA